MILVILLGMLVIVPTGLRLIAVPHHLRVIWYGCAIPGGVSLFLERGTIAAVLAAVYALGGGYLAMQAPIRLWTRRSLSPVEIAVMTALVTPVVAGVALVAERAGYRLFGFDLEVLALTVAHFHFAGFAAALMAGLVCRATPGRAMSPITALAVPAGTLVVLAGFFISPWVELAGAAILTVGMWSVAGLTLVDVRRSALDKATRALLAISAGVLAVTMPLALGWAFGEAAGLPHPSLDWMVATHGVANAFGFGLCGVAAWVRLRPEPL